MSTGPLEEKLQELEDRISRIESLLRETGKISAGDNAGESDIGGPVKRAVRGQEEIEFELGQNWFAKVGIVVLALGIVFLLTLPYPGLPPAAPGLLGYALAGVIFLLVRAMRGSFDLVSKYLRGAGMVLLFFTTLRLFYFGPTPVLEAASLPGTGLLVAVLALNLAIALRRGSQRLFVLALLTGYATAIAVGTTWFMFLIITALAVLSAFVRLRHEWTGALFFGTFMAYLAHLVWTINNPFLGNEIAIVPSPLVGTFMLLVYAAVFSWGTLARNDPDREEFGSIAASFMNGGGSYAVFLLHTALAFQQTLPWTHFIASVFYLGLAIIFWIRVKSTFTTFAYVMLGYAALSASIISSFEVPELFVWLSVQSLVVIATAVWFRSRFIVVGNFIIFLAVMIGYLAVGGEETGISVGFGIVALASARILNWQKDRLELTTEMMRNAYLFSAFTVFPYAAYHLVPGEYVSLSWVGIAGFYYLMNAIVHAPKYRWMGHLTLLLTVGYVVIIGIAKLEPTYRIISFLVLGTVLLIVSLIFTRIRTKNRDTAGSGDRDDGVK